MSHAIDSKLSDAINLTKLQAEKDRLDTLCRNIDAALADRNLQHNGRRVTGDSYHQWRAEQVRVKAGYQSQLVDLKRRIREATEAYAAFIHEQTGVARKAFKAANTAMVALFDTMLSMERQLANVRADLAASREECRRLRGKPNDGEDAWRNE